MSNTTETTPARISRVGALQASIAGGDAQRAGHPPTDCPHPANGTVVERFHGFYWRKGWAAAHNAT